jgi:rhomboid family GlyGly-CTERM serine protease
MSEQAPEFSKQRTAAQVVGGRFGVVILVFAIVLVILAWLHPQLNPIFEYHREQVLAGQFWRLLTANFLHLNINHALLNMATLVIAGLLFRDTGRSMLWWSSLLLAGSVSVGLGMLLFDTGVVSYVGLSGSLYGILAAGFLLVIKQQPHNRWLYLIIYSYICYKVLSQQFSGFDKEYLRQYIGGSVIASSHLFGLICGHIFVLTDYWIRKRKKLRIHSDSNQA